MEDPLSDFTSSNSPSDNSSPSFSQATSPTAILRHNICQLSISNLSYTIDPHSSICTSLTRRYLRPPKHNAAPPVEVLKSVSFTAANNDVLAIVGPSGAGKSTLLRILSGRIEPSLFDPGSISINGRPIASPAQLRAICGFVAQEDNLLPLLTVKETLMFTAKFRLQGMSLKAKEARVNSLMHELELQHLADAFVGSEEENRLGISGGERKRLAIAVDLIHDPLILLLDEPTSGLDSRSALRVIELLASIAQARQQILIITIHQPSFRILRHISTFLLLSHGKVAHFGTLRSLEDTIFRMGLKVPAQLNPLEFAMEINRHLEEHLQKDIVEAKQTEDFNLHHLQQNISSDNIDYGFSYTDRTEEIISLSWRCWKIMYRTKQLFLARTMHAVVGGLGLGSVYFHVKTKPDGVAERLGLFAFSLSFLLSSTVESLPIFLEERRTLMRETSRRMYRLSSYMIANTAVCVPFLLVVAVLFSAPVYWLVGLNPSLSAFMFFVLTMWMIVLMASSLVLFLSALSSDYILGNSLICLFLGIFFLFSGYFLPKDSIPKYWVFMYYVSLYRYPLDALLINEYWSMKQECFSWVGGGGEDDRDRICSMTGGAILRARGLDKLDTRWLNIGVMCCFFVLYRLLCWLLLIRRSSKTML